VPREGGEEKGRKEGDRKGGEKKKKGRLRCKILPDLPIS